MKSISETISRRGAQLLKQKEGRDGVRGACTSALEELGMNSLAACIKEFQREGPDISIHVGNKAASSELFLRKNELERLMAKKMNVPAIRLRIR